MMFCIVSVVDNKPVFVNKTKWFKALNNDIMLNDNVSSYSYVPCDKIRIEILKFWSFTDLLKSCIDAYAFYTLKFFMPKQIYTFFKTSFLKLWLYKTVLC